MNKLLTKIVSSTLGLAMAIGVGVAVGASKEPVPVSAAETEGTTQTLTITRDSFGSGSGYSVAEFSQSTTGGTSISGFGQIYLDETVSMQFNKKQGMGAIYNTVAIPGRITAISAKTASSTNRAWNAWVSSTAYSHSGTTLSAGSNATLLNNSPVTVKTSQTTIGKSTHGYSYFALIENVNNASYLENVTITYEVPKIITFDEIELSGTYPTTFTQGDTFSHDGMTVTANYTGQDPVDVSDSATFSGYDLSKTGVQSVQVSYTDAKLNVTRSVSYTITVYAPKTVSVFKFTGDIPENNTYDINASGQTTVIGDEVYYLLQFSDGTYDAAIVSWNSLDGLTFDHYPCEDSEGGFVEPTFTRNGVFVLTLSYPNVESITMTYHVSGFPSFSYLDDTLTLSNTGATGSDYVQWTAEKNEYDSIKSNATYAGVSAGSNSSIQINKKSNYGIVTTASGGKVTTFKVTFNSNTTSGKVINLYGKNTAYADTTQLYSADASIKGTLIGSVTYDGTNAECTIDVKEDISKQYAFIGVVSNSGAIYIDSLIITWKVEEEIIDTVESLTIDVSNITKTSYYVGQSVELNGIDVIAHYTKNGDVSVWNNASLEYDYNPKTITTSGDITITVSASLKGTKAVNQTFTIVAFEDGIKSINWTDRGTIIVSEGATLQEAVNTSKWNFAANYNSGKKDTTISWGDGDDQVHIGLYNEETPSQESATKLTNSYTFSVEDNGKYIVAFYKGVVSTSNKQITVTKYRKVIEETSIFGTFDFSTGNEKGTGFTSTTLGEKYKEGGIAKPTINSVSNFYDGNGSGGSLQGNGFARIGTSSKSGLIEVSFAKEIKITSVVMGLQSWSSNEHATISVTNSTDVATTSSGSFTQHTFTLSEPTNIITISSVAKRAFIDKITFYSNTGEDIGKTSDCVGLEAFIGKYLHMEDYTENKGWCNDTEHHYYASAKEAYNSLNDHQKQLFTSNSAYAAEYARLSSWASFNGEGFDASNSLAAASKSLLNINNLNDDQTSIIIIVSSLLTLAVVGGYFFLRKRKEQ